MLQLQQLNNFPSKTEVHNDQELCVGLMNENVLHLHLLMTRLSLPFNGGNFVLLSSIEFQFRYRRTDKIGPRRTLLKKDVSFRPHSEHLRGLVKQLSSSRGVLSCTLNTILTLFVWLTTQRVCGLVGFSSN